MKPHSSYAVRRLHDRVLQITFAGRMTVELTETSAKEVLALLRERPAHFYLIDSMDISSVDPAITTSGAAVLRDLRAAGVGEIVIVTPLPGARMIGRALSFATGIPMRFCDTRQEALRLVGLA